jgi:hypothetical protein
MRRAPERVDGLAKAEKHPKSAVMQTQTDAIDPSQPAVAGAPFKMRTRVMYIENKTDDLNGHGRIGRVSLSKTGKSIYYDGKTFRSLKGGYKANYFDVETNEEYWISGPKKSGGDRLYGGGGIEIDEDAREEYWLEIRKQPSRVKEKRA